MPILSGLKMKGFSTIYALILIPLIALLVFVLSLGPSLPVKTTIEPSKGPLYPTLEDTVLSACTASRSSILIHFYNIYNRANYNTLFPSQYSVSILQASYSSRLSSLMDTLPIYIPGASKPDIYNLATLVIAYSGVKSNIITVISYNHLYKASTSLSQGPRKIWCNATRSSNTLIDEVIVDPYAYKAIIRATISYTNLTLTATELGRPYLRAEAVDSCSLYLYTPSGGPIRTSYASISIVENRPGQLKVEILLDLNEITKRYGNDVGVVAVCPASDETIASSSLRILIP